ncbi:HlyD family efflux transporter periplasmic adaptor subunit [Bradyrhizobium sp. dw_78]|uniref:HlyD family secretion protein n=1 Tax=Bradyrhizobium sp. dw_78 TaxID=2719793 RepID=UPI001BD3D775|nr:HlyD family efflux transporter periplasmic adaptor subunit [Bradyrhizobium sp. dw_78]
MQDVKPDGNRTTAPVQSRTPDAAAPDAAFPVASPPALIPQPPPSSGKPGGRSKMQLWLVLAGLLVILGGGAGGWYWWTHHQAALPDGIVWGNGRLEADDIDITPKFPGRVATLLVDEGDLVKAGQVVARMDTRDTEATLRKSEAQLTLAERYLDEASANLVQQKTLQKLAQQEFDRTQTLVQKGFATDELLDQRRQALEGANAALNAATARIGETEQAIAAATQDVAYNKIEIADGVLVAPRDARVQYRLVNTGEVIGAGAKIFTLLDLSKVYMTMFLPTEDVGKIALGSEGRIVLDALPNLVVPGSVSFISPTSQFTPKPVETQSERDKLMFRIKVQVDPNLLAGHIAEVRTGLPGTAYIRFDPNVVWPARLQSKLPADTGSSAGAVPK